VATATDNPAPPDPRFGPWGRQNCQDTGPLTMKRMETIERRIHAVGDLSAQIQNLSQ